MVLLCLFNVIWLLIPSINVSFICINITSFYLMRNYREKIKEGQSLEFLRQQTVSCRGVNKWGLCLETATLAPGWKTNWFSAAMCVWEGGSHFQLPGPQISWWLSHPIPPHHTKQLDHTWVIVLIEGNGNLQGPRIKQKSRSWNPNCEH